MDRCPKCGGESGLYFKEWHLWCCEYTWDGESDGGKGGAMMYCRDCDKPIMRTSTFFDKRGKEGGDD